VTGPGAICTFARHERIQSTKRGTIRKPLPTPTLSPDNRREQTARAGVQPTVTDVRGSTTLDGGPGVPSRFVVLFRTFFAQFFTSESVSSDDQLRQTIIGVLAFLLLPGLFVLIELFFDYQGIVLRAIRYQQFDRLDDTLLWIGFVFVTYSMVTVGFVAVCIWDALTFDRRDAMVLGPLPVRGRTIVLAKIAALGAFLMAAATAVNLLNAIVFAFATADRLGAITLIRHFGALLVATVTGAVFIFAIITVVRGIIGFVAGPRTAAAVGSLLQFVFVVALLGVVMLCPAVWQVPHRALVNMTVTGWLPTSWFLALFEQLRGSRRFHSGPLAAYLQPQAARALASTGAAVAGAVLMTGIGFRRQMQGALAPATPTRVVGASRVIRTMARVVVRGDRAAAATSDFIILTLARNRVQQTAIAMNTAIAVAIVLGALMQARSIASLMHPRTTVLWIPLAVAYGIAIGLRASFFVPNDLPAAWTFAAHAPEPAAAYWSAVRAALLASVVPCALAVAVIVTVPLLGWSSAARHALFVCAAAATMIEVVALTIDFVPFTRPYQAGHAKLKTRWWIYAAGLLGSAYYPVRLELSAWDHPVAFARLLICLVIAAVMLDVIGRRRSVRWTVQPRTPPADALSSVNVLNIWDVAFVKETTC
jgi:hypothetical protein